MNDRSHRDDSIEDRLDRLIDALNAGLTPATPDDPELAGLAEAVRSADSVRETQWPDARFPRRMAARLSAELRMTSQFARQSADTSVLDASDLSPSVNGVSRAMTAGEDFDLTVPRRHSRLRTFAQMAAGFAGFALLTAILVLVFRGASDNPSLGGAPGDDPDQIAYVSSESGNAEIYLIDADGSDRTNLTNSPARDTMPSWSPDGEQIAFVSDRDGRDAIYIMNTDGSNRRLFVDGEGRTLLYPTWSPDGAMIAYVEAEGPDTGFRAEVIARKLDGSNWWPAQVQMDRGGDFAAALFPPLAWSPDSSQVAFAGGGEDASLYRWSPLDGAIGRTELSGGRQSLWPSWSPDGSRLAYAVDRGLELWEVVNDGTTIVPLPVDGEVVSHIEWSPDGRTLVVSSSSDEASGLHLVSVDGSGVRPLTDDRSDLWPVWSQDGTTIAFLRQSLDPQGAETYTLMTIEPDGGEVHELATGIGSLEAGPPSWRPVATEPDDGEQALATATPTAENGSAEVEPTPPNTPNASIAVVPYELTCDSSVAVVGSGFAPGSTVDIFIGEDVPVAPDGGAVVSTTAGEDGTFQFEDLVSVSKLIPDCEGRAAAGGGQLTIRAASVIEVDGEQRYAEPAAHTPIFLTPTSDAPERAMVDQATAAAREFLNEPEATFEVLEVNQEDGRYVRISRQAGDAYDEFRYDVDRGEITSATIQSHTSAYASPQPVNAEQALEIAEATASQTHAAFDELTLYETFDQGTIPGGDGQDQVLSATWQLKVNDQVWVPTTLQVDVDMQTGLVLGYWFTHEPYQGPLDAQVTQEDAVAIAEEAIASEPTLAGASIGTAELAISYAAAEAEWLLVWRIHLENAPESAPSHYIEIDAITGELLTEFGEPGGQG